MKKEQWYNNDCKLENENVTEHDCEDCFEQYFFKMKDKDHEFSLGLTVVLDCLAQAQSAGVIPPIDNEWWIKVTCRYNG